MPHTDAPLVLSCTLPETSAGKRFDQALAECYPDYSRSQLQAWIKLGQITLNGRHEQGKFRILGGEKIALTVTPVKSENWVAQAQDFPIVYEDEHLLVINKPVGMVVHPGAGHQDHTLVNALLYYAPQLESLPRAGLVHRLDKDTSGLLIVAKTLPAHTHLVAALQVREICREYECVVNGLLVAGGTVDAPLGRHPRERLKRAVMTDGKEAVTHYRVMSRFRRHTHLYVRLETGRTHQIRVHLAHINYPVVGDTLYGGRPVLPQKAAPELISLIQHFNRQALHAKRLSLNHPISGLPLVFEAPLPEDMTDLITMLQKDHDDALYHA